VLVRGKVSRSAVVLRVQGFLLNLQFVHLML
jgi:hypothetical protein